MGRGCGEESRNQKEVAGQFAVKYMSETTCWTHSLNKQDYGIDQYSVLLAVKNNKLLRTLVLLVKSVH